jgi:hypothetical protein
VQAWHEMLRHILEIDGSKRLLGRLRVVLILLILILLAASIAFGVMTYWVDARAPMAPPPGEGSLVPVESSFLRSAPLAPWQRGFCWEVET